MRATRTQQPSRQASRRRTSALTMGDCRALFHMPVERAAQQLGVSRPTIARVLRANGVARWPYRSYAAQQRNALRRAQSDHRPLHNPPHLTVRAQSAPAGSIVNTPGTTASAALESPLIAGTNTPGRFSVVASSNTNGPVALSSKRGAARRRGSSSNHKTQNIQRSVQRNEPRKISDSQTQVKLCPVTKHIGKSPAYVAHHRYTESGPLSLKTGPVHSTIANASSFRHSIANSDLQNNEKAEYVSTKGHIGNSREHIIPAMNYQENLNSASTVPSIHSRDASNQTEFQAEKIKKNNIQPYRNTIPKLCLDAPFDQVSDLALPVSAAMTLLMEQSLNDMGIEMMNTARSPTNSNHMCRSTTGSSVRENGQTGIPHFDSDKQRGRKQSLLKLGCKRSSDETMYRTDLATDVSTSQPTAPMTRATKAYDKIDVSAEGQPIKTHVFPRRPRHASNLHIGSNISEQKVNAKREGSRQLDKVERQLSNGKDEDKFSQDAYNTWCQGHSISLTLFADNETSHDVDAQARTDEETLFPELMEAIQDNRWCNIGIQDRAPDEGLEEIIPSNTLDGCTQELQLESIDDAIYALIEDSINKLNETGSAKETSDIIPSPCQVVLSDDMNHDERKPKNRDVIKLSSSARIVGHFK